MEPRFQAYQNARQAVLNARAALPDVVMPPDDPGADLPAEVEVLAAAQEDLATAETAVAVELDAAWQANRQAITDALEAVMVAQQDRAQVEITVGNAARARNPSFPVLTDDELAQAQAAAVAVDEARAVLEAAKVTFKAGVTVEQLETV